MGSDANPPFAAARSTLESVKDFLDPAVVQHARTALDDAAARYDTVGNHTVVALVGGTGSGKSSLFNALTRSHFADDGYLRPTTRRASACVWGPSAAPLLDFLGVDTPRRMQIDPAAAGAPTPDQQASGLVLLDLPDNDSVEETHLLQVEQLLPVVDVLVWVVDPQKYGDHLLHQNYLSTLSRRKDAMVVVLNQADTLTARGRETVLADIHRLLEQDGLDGVDVLTTCALDGSGVDQLWQRLLAAVGTQSTAQRTARAELAAVAHSVLAHLGTSEAHIDNAVLSSVSDRFLAAAGLDAVVGTIRGRGTSPVGPQTPGRAAVAAIGSEWAAQATAGLPPRWAHAVEEALPAVGVLQDAIAQALAAPPLPTRRWFITRAGRELAAQEYQERVRASVADRVRAVLIQPTAQVLDVHASARAALESIKPD